MIRADLATAVQFYRALRAWRRQGVRGHMWLYVGLRPGHPAVVERRTILRTPGLAVVVDPSEHLMREVLA